MACTTILVGRNASCDGSTMIARDDDSPSGRFTPKKFAAIRPQELANPYRSVLSHAEIALPADPMRFTAVPNALEGVGIWAASGVNAANVAMTATETITSNERVVGADPYVVLRPAENGAPEQPGGIGEEDLVMLVLPYIRSAREGVERLGSLLARYGTYEANGIAFQDAGEIWWLESVGGHHWIARRVPDDACVVMPNQLGLDRFDLADALGEGKEFLCSPDLEDFIRDNRLFPLADRRFNPREVLGSRTDADHVYNTPRAWYMGRYLTPRTHRWDGPDAEYGPESDDIPWSFAPERKVTPEDVKYLLSSHFQGTPYDPYATFGGDSRRGMYRSIGVNRNDFCALIQLRPYLPEDFRAVEWLAFGSNAFNAMAPFYANVGAVPEYLANTGRDVSTENFYWSNRLIAALADAHYGACLPDIERYQFAVQSKGRAVIGRYDRLLADAPEPEALREQANREIADMLREETRALLNKVLCETSCRMKNSYARSDV
jgi:dipeptidase